MTEPALKLEISDRVARVTLNRPESFNAVGGELHKALSRIFIDLGERRDLSAIVLTGAGKAFCAGGDIQWMRDAVRDPEQFEVVTWEAKRIVYSMLDCEIPIIGRINGDAVGLGATLALLCDITVMDEKARIGDPHVRVGLNAADGGGFLWPAVIGYGKARELLLTGDLLSAAEAKMLGAIGHVVPTEELDAKVDAIVAKLRNGATKAIRWTKAGYTIPLRQLAHGHMDAGTAYECLTNLTRDHSEAIEAFAAKRKPVFEGR
ncbi:enoyl-CoA hydratase/isomerase family protein [Caldimonas thermodepolymerans]|uniref:enoyl-CoA hydratase/isomerase family protein n=1 Tax=Caldimonas thermodepolymerans TaxID=215580 RepID=UPI002236548E|nr:enoyl-CoA hydratase/isomerase family protein [Caldimonas thermodepolymerans]UZG44406.1 enoyl-CoA hydratase/isomerase family protein [Caldimonas thermodepolymerans]